MLKRVRKEEEEERVGVEVGRGGGGEGGRGRERVLRGQARYVGKILARGYIVGVKGEGVLQPRTKFHFAAVSLLMGQHSVRELSIAK
ncbi:hypothetical protein M0802_011238 [Mischocyttarus mexicanus]|nr:hypothetical protein M0802_011238 [Mischocyttarus mexicanus]